MGENGKERGEKWKGKEMGEACVGVGGRRKNKKNGRRNEGAGCGRLWRKKMGEEFRNGEKLGRWGQPAVWRKKNIGGKKLQKERKIQKNEGGKK